MACVWPILVASAAKDDNSSSAAVSLVTIVHPVLIFKLFASIKAILSIPLNCKAVVAGINRQQIGLNVDEE